METYHNLVKDVLKLGEFKESRTGIDTIYFFGYNYKIDLSEGFPLLTTKKMNDYRWNSLIHEFLWYISGQEHIKELKEKTKIWDAWADKQGYLETAYGRFWRRYPIPEKGLDGEIWADEIITNWVNIEKDGSKTFDQVKYVLDTIKNNPNSRRITVNAWHPANSSISKLPPCHFAFVFDVNKDKLNLHLTQRSGDIALGIPFNIAAYSILDTVFAQQSNLKPGIFDHLIVNAHIYCGRSGEGQRGEFYENNILTLKDKMNNVNNLDDYLIIKDWIEKNAPKEIKGEEGYDHVPGLLEQLSRIPRSKPKLKINNKSLEELQFEDFNLLDYDPYPGIKFKVAV